MQGQTAGWDIAEQNRTGQVRAWPRRAGKCGAGPNRTTPGRVRQGSTRQDRARSDETGQGHEGSISAGQGWARPDRTWHGKNQTGAAKAVFGSAGPGKIG